jgi:hypothetical protein
LKAEKVKSHLTGSSGRATLDNAIFDEVDVPSRKELTGQVFAQKYQPRMATATNRTPIGSSLGPQ